MKSWFLPTYLTRQEKIMATMYFAVNSILDPTRGEMIAGLAEVSGWSSFVKLLYSTFHINYAFKEKDT